MPAASSSGVGPIRRHLISLEFEPSHGEESLLARRPPGSDKRAGLRGESQPAAQTCRLNGWLGKGESRLAGLSLGAISGECTKLGERKEGR